MTIYINRRFNNSNTLNVKIWSFLKNERKTPDTINLCYADKPPRVARQIKPPLYRNEHEQYMKMCLCNTGGLLKIVFKV